MIDLATADVLLSVAGAYLDRALPAHLRADLEFVRDGEHLPFRLRRDAWAPLSRDAKRGEL